MLWMIPLALAAAGALADKKHPLQGAAIGAGLGLTGGAAAGLLGGAAAGGATGATLASTAPEMANGAFLGESAVSGIPAWDAAATGAKAATAGGLLGGSASNGGLMGALDTYGKPASQAMQLASQSGLMGGQQQPQGTPFVQPQGNGPSMLAQLAQQGDPSQQLAQEDMMRRKRRLGLLGREVA